MPLAINPFARAVSLDRISDLFYIFITIFNNRPSAVAEDSWIRDHSICRLPRIAGRLLALADH